ncbi:MAG TPA: CHASE sensor domain-containing protein, partial [Fimbriimonadaceae bacterium]|nr:CHASE sensor domain-containing protein [Fimbriimonadaceae bacterium]
MVRNISLRGKLVLISVVPSLFALALATYVFLAYDWHQAREHMVHDLRAEAEILGSNSAAALAFEDAAAARDLLSSLSPREDVLVAAVYTPDGKPLARYIKQGVRVYVPPKSQSGKTYFEGNSLKLFQPIVHKGAKVGVVYMESSLQNLTERQQNYLLIMTLVAAAAALLVTFVAARLQRLISAPVLQLVQATQLITERKDYSVRLDKHGSDEVGQLIDGFNSMLAEVQKRDGILKSTNEDLEARVEGRTHELKL